MEHDHTAFGNVEEPLWLCEEPSIAHEHRTLQMVEDPVGSTVSRFSQGLPSHGGVHDMEPRLDSPRAQDIFSLSCCLRDRCLGI